MTANRVATLVILALLPNAFCELTPCTNGEDGWYLFERFCYKVVEYGIPIIPLNWNKARTYCSMLRADLVSITSKDENDYVAEVLKSYNLDKSRLSWIGLMSYSRSAPYKWTDGSIFDYNNWVGPTSIFRMNSDNCGVINNEGEWKKEGCEVQLRSFICKKAMESVTETPFVVPNTITEIANTIAETENTITGTPPNTITETENTIIGTPPTHPPTTHPINTASTTKNPHQNSALLKLRMSLLFNLSLDYVVPEKK